MKFLKCVCYLAITGLVGFLFGRVLPKKWLRPDKGLFRCFPCEKGGRVYEKIGIRRWQNRVPDMSRILPGWMPVKRLGRDFAERLPDMIRETCVAELVHILHGLGGLYCAVIWPGVGGSLMAAVNGLFLNLPFILIQRYNRPRLTRLLQKQREYIKRKEELVCAH